MRPTLPPAAALGHFIRHATGPNPTVVGSWPYDGSDPLLRLWYTGFDAADIGIVAVTTVDELGQLGAGPQRGAATALHVHRTDTITSDAANEADARRRSVQFLERVDSLRDSGVAIVWTVRELFPFGTRYRDLECELRNELAQRADLIHVMRPDLPAVAQPSYHLPERKVCEIPHPAYDDVFPSLGFSRGDVRSQLGAGPNDVVLLVRGATASRRALARYLRLAEELRADDHAAFCVIVGPSVAESTHLALDSIIRDVDQHPYAAWAGSRPTETELVGLHAAADLVVVDDEIGFDDTALVQAITCRTPVLLPAACAAGLPDGAGGTWGTDRDLASAVLATLHDADDERLAQVASTVSWQQRSAGATSNELARVVRRKSRALHRSIATGRTPQIELDHPLVHCCYHKIGTVWFQGIMRAIGRRYGLSVGGPRRGGADGAGAAYRATHDIVVDPHSRLRFDDAPDFRGSHMIRDPRDVAVSGYKYHLWTHEHWVHQPAERWGGLTYQQHLNSLGPEEGLAVEIRRVAATQIARMAAWDYSDPRFFEIRYEDMIGNEPPVLRALFQHYDWPADHLDDAVELADSFSFQRVKEREAGVGAEGHHLRSGRPQQWREHFTPALIELAKDVLGESLVTLGYESDTNWH